MLILAAIQMPSLMSVASQHLSSSRQPTESECRVAGTSKITIACAYMASSSTDADSRTVPRIILNRALISLTPSEEGLMRVELTFTNGTKARISGHRTLYLSIDGEGGENYIRRPLPGVDFTKLKPGRPVSFQEAIPVAKLRAGPYIVSLWIPSTVASLKFDSTHNLLLSSKGVADLATGLNRIAKFTVTPQTEAHLGLTAK